MSKADVTDWKLFMNVISKKNETENRKHLSDRWFVETTCRN